jgi:hypothetical protein
VSSPKGFVLQSSFGEVLKSHRFCSPEEWQPSSGSNKAPLGMDLDLVFVMDPVLDLGLYPDPALLWVSLSVGCCFVRAFLVGVCFQGFFLGFCGHSL